jgi:3-mercaptopyruvate sulfurtransferase SseA
MSFKIPTENQISDQLKSMGIGKETKVICYDNLDGTMATRGAFLLSAFGVKDVSILNGKFSTWCPESSEKLTAVPKATGAIYEFKLD